MTLIAALLGLIAATFRLLVDGSGLFRTVLTTLARLLHRT